MPEFDAPQFAAGPLATLGYAEEVSFGKIPADVELKVARRVSTDIGLTKDSYQSEEIRGDRMTADMRHGIRRAGGNVVTELSPGSHADWMAALLGSFWEQPIPIDASDVQLTATLVNGLLEVTATSFDFIAAGMTLGASVTFLGTGTAYLNGKLYTVVSHASNKVRLLPPKNFVLASPAVLSAGTFEIKGARLQMGNILRSFVFERAFTDIGSFIVYTGMRANSYAVELPPTGISRGTFAFMGKDALPIALASIDGVAEITLDATDLTSLVFNAAPGSITAGGGNFVTAGFQPGDKVLISGDGITDEQNRNPRTVLTVAPTVLTVAEAIETGGPYTGTFEVTRVGLPEYSEVSDEQVLVAVSGALILNGEKIATITDARFTIDNGMGGSEVVGSNVIPAMMFGNRCTVSGSLTVLFDRAGAGEALYNAFDLEEDNLVPVIRLDKADGSGGLSFVFPRAKPSTGTIGDAVATGIPVTVEFTAIKPRSSSPELGRSQIYIYDTTKDGVPPLADPLTITMTGETTGGVATFVISGGVAPYTFDPGDGEDPITKYVAGAFTYDYLTDGDYTVEVTDTATNTVDLDIEITTVP